ncbi:MAG: autorepressor SdpR family transcription factor [Peptococcaceae bacterium]|jgi:DNA-binding transcriptional ArsR family regulator|nr:autorepressor SdpR family transcription factor [Peptococcaceae bacterium]MDH7526385.1 autorepressor SdpR family transcription factor [Peptococcaceae bacterium]
MSPLNATFKALSDPSRRKILQLLRSKPMTAGEIANQFNISKPSISHHLNVLKQADLIEDERQGQNIVYTLNTSVFDNIINWFLTLTGKPVTEVESNE